MQRVVIALLIALTLLASAGAARAVGLQAIGVDAGLVNPKHVDTTLGFGFLADFGNLTDLVGWRGSFDYWSQSHVSDYAFGTDLQYLFVTSRPALTPFVAAGAGLHIFHFDFANNGDTRIRLGARLGGGVELEVTRQITLVGEGWYTIVEDYSHLSVLAGIQFALQL